MVAGNVDHVVMSRMQKITLTILSTFNRLRFNYYRAISRCIFLFLFFANLTILVGPFRVDFVDVILIELERDNVKRLGIYVDAWLQGVRTRMTKTTSSRKQASRWRVGILMQLEIGVQ